MGVVKKHDLINIAYKTRFLVLSDAMLDYDEDENAYLVEKEGGFKDQYKWEKLNIETTLSISYSLLTTGFPLPYIKSIIMSDCPYFDYRHFPWRQEERWLKRLGWSVFWFQVCSLSWRLRSGLSGLEYIFLCWLLCCCSESRFPMFLKASEILSNLFATVLMISRSVVSYLGKSLLNTTILSSLVNEFRGSICIMFHRFLPGSKLCATLSCWSCQLCFLRSILPVRVKASLFIFSFAHNHRRWKSVCRFISEKLLGVWRESFTWVRHSYLVHETQLIGFIS